MLAFGIEPLGELDRAGARSEEGGADVVGLASVVVGPVLWLGRGDRAMAAVPTTRSGVGAAAVHIADHGAPEHSHPGVMSNRHLPSSFSRTTFLSLLLALGGGGVVAPAVGLAAAAPAEVSYDWPIADGEITRPFDAPEEPWLPGHRGADLAASPGHPVLAAADGVVAFAGSVAGKPVVSIDHDDGIRTTYEPVLAQVSAGDAVVGGQVIGTLEPGHGLDDLHWGARRDGEGRPVYLDPASLIEDDVVIRLYPLRDLGSLLEGAVLRASAVGALQ